MFRHGLWACVGIVLLATFLGPSLVAQPVTIKMVGWNATPEFNRIMELFSASQNEVVIEYRALANYRDSVVTMYAGGVAPDIVHANPDEFAIDFFAKGMFIPLDGYIAREKELDLSDVLPGAWWYTKHEGKTYGWPFMGSAAVTTGVHYNRDHFAEAGVAMPSDTWTYDEFVAIGKKLTLDSDSDGTPERYGTQPPAVNWNWDWVWSNGGEYVTPDFRTCLLDEPSAYQGLQRMADLGLVHRVASPFGTGGYSFRQGSTSMSFAPALAGIRAAQKEIRFDWGLAPVPAQAVGSVGRGGSLVLGISNQSQHPEAAWRFFKWLVNPQTERMLIKEGTPLIPVNRSVLLAPSYWKLDGPPYDLRPFLTRTAKAFPYFAKWADLQRDLNALLPSVMRGQKSARAAMEEFVPAQNAMLRAGQG